MFFVLWVLATVWMFVCFRLFERYQVRTFQAIVANYWVCALLGFSLKSAYFSSHVADSVRWGSWALVLGGLFISTFYLTGLATKHLGLAVVTLASKLSFILPSLLSLWLIPNALASMTLLKWLGLGLGFVAVFCSVYQPKKTDEQGASEHPNGKSSVYNWLLPLLVFVLGGIIDSLLNIANERFFEGQEANPFFVIGIFSVAGLCGSLVLLWQVLKDKKTWLRPQEYLWGALLGIPNYFSVELMLLVLKDYNNNGALVFPIYNLSIIASSACLGAFFFKEKLGKLNLLGLFLAGVTILLMLW